jgi:hypothetical protein
METLHLYSRLAGRRHIQQTQLLLLLCCSGPFWATLGEAQDQQPLAGEKAAQTLKESLQAEAQTYNIHYGPVGIRVGASMGFGYTDNVFYSQTNRQDDYVFTPQVTFDSFMQVSELNSLRLSVGLGYEYYFRNSSLNGDAPLVSPNTELAFNIFAGNFHIRLHENFTYQQSLFINTTPNGQNLLFNFNNVSGTFSRWDNLVGFTADWDLDRVVVTAGYDHENFVSDTALFDYLTRESELFKASIGLLVGDHAKVGIEGQGAYHNYDSQATLDDHWQARFGPFAEVKTEHGLTFRASGGPDKTWYDTAGETSDYSSYYVVGTVSQETRLFTHSLSAGNEHLPGDNANNLRDTYISYAISSPVLVEHVDLGLTGAFHWAKEFGGGFEETYTYGIVGAKVGYQLHRYWRAEVGYEYLAKFSELPERDYHRNRATVALTFTF